jgi:Na+-transporting NADH:ubiquinone oxidoreductase subunit NqrC
LIRKIDFSGAILSIKKRIAELEKYKIKTTRIRYLIMPFAILGIFFMIIQKPIFNTESIIMLVLIILVFISSIYYTFKYSIYEQYKKLNKEINEIEELEKK